MEIEFHAVDIVRGKVLKAFRVPYTPGLPDGLDHADFVPFCCG
jgi:hypothetical protein